MTEAEFLQSHIILTNEVENALESLYIYKHSAKSNHKGRLLRMSNRQPESRMIIHPLKGYRMVTSEVVRFYDTDRRSHSIHRLLKEMIKHPEYFSRDAFANRRRGPLPSPDPAYLADYLKGVFEPDKATLEKLEVALEPISNKYEQDFAPIRNKLFAHRDILDRSGINALVGKGLIADLEEILHFLHDLLACIFQLIHNGSKPELGRGIYDYKTRAKEATEGALKRLLDIRPI